MDTQLAAETFWLWLAALATLAVVTLVVAALLYLLHREARAIKRVVDAVWQAGQRVAGNTVHVPLLYGTAAAAEGIVAHAGTIAEDAAAIAAHAESCPGCPHCLWPATRGARP